MIYLCVCVFLWLSCKVFASRGDGRFSVWLIQFMRGDIRVSWVSSINYISIFPVKQRAETVIHSIMFVMQRRTTVFSIWKKFTISCSVASCQHTKTNSIHQGWFGSANRVALHCCLSVTMLFCCSKQTQQIE